MSQEATAQEASSVVSSKQLLLVGAAVGALTGGGLGILCTFANLGGRGEWVPVVPGMAFNGAFLGLVAGAVAREHRAGQRTETGVLRRTLLWLGVAVVVTVAGTVMWIR
jgi:hypothetical protein